MGESRPAAGVVKSKSILSSEDPFEEIGNFLYL